VNKKVVITGIGIVSPYGIGVELFWSSIISGTNAIKAWQPEGVKNFPVRYAATIDLASLKSGFPHCFVKASSMERRAIFGLVAGDLALQDAGVSKNELKVLGVSVCGGVPYSDDLTLATLTGSGLSNEIRQMIERRDELFDYNSGYRCGNDVLAIELAERFETAGPMLNVNGACAGATQSIGLAYKAIQRGEADAMLAGGGDSVMNLRTLSALVALGATTTSRRFSNTLSRPFDKDRSGLVPGEGAAIILLEEKEAAINRSAKIYCEISGYGSSFDAYKVTAPHPEGRGAISSMQQAIDNANIQPEDIGYINAHGTSTPLNDVVESEAISHVFKSHCDNGLLVSSTKSMIGHWIAAAGAPEAVATIMALKHQCIPPTINLNQADERCKLDYVSGTKRFSSIKYALSNSFGFGGINATLVFGR